MTIKRTNNRPVIYRVSGHVGAGKTTCCKRVAEILGFQYNYIGDIMKRYGAQRGQTKEEFFTDLKNNPNLEREIDDYQQELMKTRGNLIAEGRMAPWLWSGFPYLNILFVVKKEVAVHRLVKRKLAEANICRPPKQSEIKAMLAEVSRREAEEQERYLSLYNIKNIFEENHFNIIIDTTDLKPEAVVTTFLQRVSEFHPREPHW